MASMPAMSKRRSGQPFFSPTCFSGTEREIDAGVFWGPLHVNGLELAPVTCPEMGNRQNARVRLRAGWNFNLRLPGVEYAMLDLAHGISR